MRASARRMRRTRARWGCLCPCFSLVPERVGSQDRRCDVQVSYEGAPDAEEGKMNWIGIILATVAAMVIGFLWYGQWGFGKSWMALVGRPTRIGVHAEGVVRRARIVVIDLIGALIGPAFLPLLFDRLRVVHLCHT